MRVESKTDQMIKTEKMRPIRVSLAANRYPYIKVKHI